MTRDRLAAIIDQQTPALLDGGRARRDARETILRAADAYRAAGIAEATPPAAKPASPATARNNGPATTTPRQASRRTK